MGTIEFVQFPRYTIDQDKLTVDIKGSRECRNEKEDGLEQKRRVSQQSHGERRIRVRGKFEQKRNARSKRRPEEEPREIVDKERLKL